MSNTKRTLFININKLYQTRTSPPEVVLGLSMHELPAIDNAYLLVENQYIKAYGSMANCPDYTNTDTLQIVDVANKLLLPGFCDSHTHIVFAAPRNGEFVDRIKGLSYEEIAAKGGGILNSANTLQKTDFNDLYNSAWGRLQEVISMGTVAIEIKSGYGLSVDSELKMLRVIAALKEKSPIPIKSTFLGAHAVPTSYKNNRQDYINSIVEDMLPQIAANNLADYIDVFCDKGFFTVSETDYLLKAGKRYGLQAKIHANELAISGGVQVGIANQAISVDHLEQIGAKEIIALQNSQTIPTVLPGTSFFLNIPYAPAKQLMEADLPLCIASDYNPGSTPSGNMPLVMALACTQMKILPEQAYNAATINGAAAMQMSDILGSITTGKLASFIVTKPMQDISYIPYAYGSNHIDQVWVAGKRLY